MPYLRVSKNFPVALQADNWGYNRWDMKEEMMNPRNKAA